MMILRGHCSRSQARSFHVTVGSNCCAIHSDSVLRPPVPFMRASRLPKLRRLPVSTLNAQRGPHRDLERVLQRETRRNGQAVLRVAAPQALHRHVDGEHDGRAVGRLGAVQQLHVEAAIAHQVDLEPERLLHRAAHVFDGADGHAWSGRTARRRPARRARPASRHWRGTGR